MIITITGDSASFYIKEITDGSTKYQFDISSLFELEIVNNATFAPRTLTSISFAKSSCKVYPDNKLKITYYDSGLAGILKVHITGVSGENREADLGIEVMCKVPGYTLKSVKFPILKVQALGGDNSTQVIAVPATKIGGAYYRRPSTGTSLKTFNYPGSMGMQYVSLYNYAQGHNLYMQALDREAFIKDFVFAGNSSGTSTELYWNHFPVNGDEVFKSFHPSYKIRLDSMTGGDWYDASVKYRDWATGQFWATYRGKIYQDPSGRHSTIAKKNRISLLQSPVTIDADGFNGLKSQMDTLLYGIYIYFSTIVAKEEVTSIWYDWHGQRSLITPYTPHPDWTNAGGLSEGLYDAVAEAQSDGYAIVPYTYSAVQYPERDQTWYNANSFDLNYVKVYEAGRLQSVSSQVQSNNRIYNEATELYNLIDSQRKDFNDAVYHLNTGITVQAEFKGIYYDVYPSEVPVNYNPFVPLKGGSPRQHMGFVDNHLRLKAFATGYLSGDFVQVSEYGNEISIMDTDLPNYYRAELSTGDVTIQSNTGLITAPLLTTVYHEYGRFGSFDYMGTGQDVARIYHDGAIPGLLLIRVDGYPLPVIGNVIPYGIEDIAAYTPVATDILSTMSSFITSSGASDKFLVYGQKLRPISGSREYLMTRYDAPPTGVQVQSTAWKSQDNKIGVVMSCCAITGSQRIRLTSGQYLSPQTAYDLYVASGTFGSWNNFVYSGRYTGYYDDTVRLTAPYMVKVLEFRP